RRGALAAADDGAGVAHAASRRGCRARDESRDGLLAVFLDPLSGFFFRAATDLTNHDDALRLRVVVEELDYVEMRRAIDRVATDADAGALANVTTGELPHRFVGQRAA